MEEIVVGGGCFWCIEAIFSQLRGIKTVVSGYAGGSVHNPSYEAVCSGRTGHAEVVKVAFDSEIISLQDLLSIFFTLHDPTTPNQQGADVGTQYRSIILYKDASQKETAEAVMNEIIDSGIWEDRLVTELVPLEEFYEADEHHQAYYEKYAQQGYCRIVIEPKVAKLRSLFFDKLKS
jgi:peptide-methionine (S)-S-oxide reductase